MEDDDEDSEIDQVLLTAALGTTLIAATACSSAGGSNGQASGSGGSGGTTGPVTVGLMVPLTGDLAQPGGWIQDGVKYGVKQVNEAGGINGSKIDLQVVDTAGDPTQTVTAANKLINQDKAQFIIGPITSQGMTAVLPTETRNDVAAIGVVGSPSLTPKKMRYGFSMLLNAGDQAQAMVNYAHKQGYSKSRFCTTTVSRACRRTTP